jgi:hypothetical protein
MNRDYSKENVILESVRTILVNDNGILTGDVKSIHQYCEDRIIRKMAFINPPDDKLITIDVAKNNENIGLPSSTWYLSVTAIIPMDQPYAQDDVSRMATRIVYLLNKKPADLNNVAPQKYLRCRFIINISVIPADDGALKIHKRECIFEIIADDEILNLNQ